MALTPGTRLGQYEILSAIGAGGMGEVYRAKDSKLGRDVAIKVLPEAVAQDAERLARFEREARTLATLNHPNIVTIFAVEESGGTRFLTMELVEGETLDTVIAWGGLPLSRFFDITVPLAEALSAAHERGIVHRDLKPGNVMVTREGRVKVLDFGLAKLEGSSSDPDVTNTPAETRANLTGEGQVFGTVAYMSPEQARGGKVDARSDVFSLGVVLYQLLTGERPFQGGSAVDMISSILRDKPPSVTDLRADLPPHLGKIIRRCLEKDPRDRYQTSRDVYNELKELRAETSTASTAAAASSPRSETAGGARPPSGPIRTEEGFWVAVLPFKYTGGNADVTALAEGLTEDIVTGLSRFSYLKVIARGSTARFVNEVVDVRAAGRDLGARYVMEGNLRQAGGKLRLAVQLVDTSSGAHLWAETYERTFSAEAVFELQDDLVPRIVSTCADTNGVLPRSMSESVRSRPPAELSPYEAVLRSFSYFERVSVEELAAARSALELAVRNAPAYADAWAMLALLCAQDYGQGFNLLPDPLGSGAIAARRAVEAGSSNHLAHFSLAQVLFFQKDYEAFRNAAARAAALNPMDGTSIAFLGELLIYSGDSERGLALARRAKQLNPNHPGWYWYADFYHLYRERDYPAALAVIKKVNLPGHWGQNCAIAAVCGQLGEREAGEKAVRRLLELRPDFADVARQEFGKWWDPDYAEHAIDGLRKAGLDLSSAGGSAVLATEVNVSRGPGSGATRADEGFWVAVLPFKCTAGNADVTALAEGLSEEIVAGLSRFSYLRVITSGSTQRYAGEAPDLRVVGKDLGARYVMNGNLRQVGARLRVAVQLVDTTTGAHLWAENYERTFSPEAVFELQDDLVPRIVSTVADSHGVLLHSMSEALRSKSADQLSPYEAVLRSFGYFERVNAEELAAARSALELAVRKAPGYADAWAMLALLCAQEYGQGYSLLADSLAAGSIAARRAVEAGPSNHLAHSSLAQVLFLQKELQAFRNAAARAAALNPMDGATMAFMGILLAYAGDWEHGCALADKAMRLNPHFPGWYRLATIVNAYRTRDYRAAIDAALRIQMPGYFWTPVLCAAAFGQLDERESARKALGELLAIRPGFGSTVREEFGKWHEPELVEHFIDGLRKAGLNVPALEPAGSEATPAREPGAVAIAVLPFASPDGPLGAAGGTEGLAASGRPSIVVLPFANMSPDADNEYFSDGLTEEIIADLSKVRALSVISRTSAMQLKGAKKDVRTIGRELSVRYVLEGGVRKAGDSLRITAQLIDVQTDAHLWSDKYSGTIDDVFEVQERVSREIVRALNVTLTSDEHRRLAERPIASVRAFELYLQARQEVRRMGGDALERASRLLSQAVEIEGETPPLLALMAWAKVTQVRLGIHRGPQPLDEAEVQARALLDRAPDSPAGHALLGYINYERGHLPQAVRHFKRALEREPNDADALFYMGISYIAAGQNEQARATGQRIVASDPLASLSWMLSGATGWFVGRFDESLVDLQRGLELDPQSFVLRWCVGYNCAALGQIPEAARHAAFLRETGPDVPYTRQLLALLDGLEGRKQAAMESLASIDAAPLDAHNKFHLAESFGLAGETDRALDVLEEAVDQGFYPYAFMAEHCPFLATLRPLPRFAGILAKAKERADSFQKSENGP